MKNVNTGYLIRAPTGGRTAQPLTTLQQFPFPQPGRLPENECELRDHVPGACEEVQQVP